MLALLGGSRHQQWLHLGGSLFFFLLVVGLYGLDAARQGEAANASDIGVTLTATPNVNVTAGSIVTYQVIVQNFGRGEASRALIHMPYDIQQLRVLDANFESSEDWMSAVGDDYLYLIFGAVDAGERRTATIRMQVSETLAPGTVINMWAGYGWDGANGGGTGRSANAVPVVVSEVEVNSQWAWMIVDPAAAPAGTTYGFFSDRFAPGERLHTWLNTPAGLQKIDLDKNADELGRVWFEVQSAGFEPGLYHLIVTGERTGLTAGASFMIQEP